MQGSRHGGFARERILRMTTSSSQRGRALYAWLQAEWQALGTNQEAWCREHGLSPATVSRWQTGVEPKIDAIRLVATGLRRPILDVLVAARLLSPDEAAGHDGGPPPAPTIEAALKNDPAIPRGLRPVLHDLLKAFRAVDAGETEDISGSTDRDQNKGRSK